MQPSLHGRKVKRTATTKAREQPIKSPSPHIAPGGRSSIHQPSPAARGRSRKSTSARHRNVGEARPFREAEVAVKCLTSAGLAFEHTRPKYAQGAVRLVDTTVRPPPIRSSGRYRRRGTPTKTSRDRQSRMQHRHISHVDPADPQAIAYTGIKTANRATPTGVGSDDHAHSRSSAPRHGESARPLRTPTERVIVHRDSAAQASSAERPTSRASRPTSGLAARSSLRGCKTALAPVIRGGL